MTLPLLTSRRVAGTLAFSLLCGSLGCGGEASPPVAPPPPSATAELPPAPPASPLAPSEAPRLPPPPSPFQIYAELPGEAWVAGLNDKGLLVVGQNILRVEGDGVTADPALLDGIDGLTTGTSVWDTPHLAGAFGSFPDDAWLVTDRPWGRTGITETYHWEKTRWKLGSSDENALLIDAFTARGQRVGVFQNPLIREVRMHDLRGSKAARFDLPPGDGDAGCARSVLAVAAIGLASGTVLVLGDSCVKDNAGMLTSARFEPGKRTPVMEPLPGVSAGEMVGGVSEFAERSVHLFPAADGGVDLWASLEKRTYAAHQDGKKWTEQAGVSAPTGAIQRTPEGTVWMLGEKGQLLRKPKAGPVETVTLPRYAAGDGTAYAPTGVTSLWARNDADVWAIGAFARGEAVVSALLHTHPNPTPGAFPALARQVAAFKAARVPGPLRPGCTTPFVFLFAPTKTAPADFDYPLTRKALTGHKEFADAVFVEWTAGPRRFFGARVPTAELARRMTALITKELKGSSPQAVCHDPEVTRTLEIDLATGNVVKR